MIFYSLLLFWNSPVLLFFLLSLLSLLLRQFLLFILRVEREMGARLGIAAAVIAEKRSTGSGARRRAEHGLGRT